MPGPRADLAPPLTDLKKAVRACKFRDYNLEGIPMFLVLEDLCASPGGSTTVSMTSAAGGQLGRLAEDYFGRLVADRSRFSLDDVATALEVLAAHHFEPVSGEDLQTNMTTFGGLAGGPLIRTINFHNTPQALAAEVCRRLSEAGEWFGAVGEEDLGALLSGRPERLPGRFTEPPLAEPPLAKPPLIPVFYEGYRNNYDVALPMLERAGLRGWFFIPTAFIDTPVSEQYTFARTHYIGLTGEDYPGKRCAMSWDELREVVARGHIVACHTATHCPITYIRSPEEARRELVDSRRRLEDELGCEIKILAGLLGTSYGEDPRSDAFVREAGYQLVFSNAKIQRVPSNAAPPNVS